MNPAQYWLMILVVVAAAAVVVQMIALIAIAVAAKRIGERVGALSETFESRGLPLLLSLQDLLTDAKPKLDSVLTNLSENSSKVKPLLDSVQATLTDTKPKLDLVLSNLSDTTARLKPLLETAQGTLTEAKPKLGTVLDNLAETTSKVKAQVEMLETNVEPLLERVKLQTVRADEMITRIMNRIDFVSDLVERGVKAPATRASGLWQGLSAGLSVLFGKRAPNGGSSPPKDNTFL